MTAPRRPKQHDDDDPVLPDITDDERPIGWGDELSGDRDDADDNSRRRDEQWYRRERPPHHE